MLCVTAKIGRPCLNRVNLVGLTMSEPLPLYPSKPTFAVRTSRSERCQLRTCRHPLEAREDNVLHAGVDRMAGAAANLFFNKDMRLYLPLPVGLAFKKSHSAAGNWRRLLIHH